MEQIRPRVVITGAAGNLGRAAAAAFAQRGAHLILVDIDLERLRVAYPGESADRLLVAVDLTDEASVLRVLVPAIKPLGPISALCNIAGGFLYGDPVHRTQSTAWNRLHALNAGTALNAIRSVSGLPNVHLVVSSRPFEYHHDVRLRSMSAVPLRPVVVSVPASPLRR